MMPKIFKKHQNVDNDLIGILFKIVKFNPKDRAQVNELLEDPIFQ